MSRFSSGFFVAFCSILLGSVVLGGAARAQLDHFNVYSSAGAPPPAVFQPVTIAASARPTGTIFQRPRRTK